MLAARARARKLLCNIAHFLTTLPRDTQDPGNAVKISQEEEKVLKFQREIEAARQKRLVQARKVWVSRPPAAALTPSVPPVAQAEERRTKADEREGHEQVLPERGLPTGPAKGKGKARAPVRAYDSNMFQC